jgi:hypothetical protein
MPKREAPDENAAISESEAGEREPAHDLREAELTDVVGGTKTITLDVEAIASIEQVTKPTTP